MPFHQLSHCALSGAICSCASQERSCSFACSVTKKQSSDTVVSGFGRFLQCGLPLRVDEVRIHVSIEQKTDHLGATVSGSKAECNIVVTTFCVRSEGSFAHSDREIIPPGKAPPVRVSVSR